MKKQISLLLAVLILIPFVLSGCRKNTKSENAASMTKCESRFLNFWLYTPKNAHENLPLIVYLHGSSGKGNYLEKVTDSSLPNYTEGAESVTLVFSDREEQIKYLKDCTIEEFTGQN